MITTLGWRIFYDGDREFTARTGTPEDDWSRLPGIGAIAMTVWYHRSEDDQTYWHSVQAEWFVHRDSDDLFVYANNSTRTAVEAKYPGAVVIEGRWPSEDERVRVNAKASNALGGRP